MHKINNAGPFYGNSILFFFSLCVSLYISTYIKRYQGTKSFTLTALTKKKEKQSTVDAALNKCSPDRAPLYASRRSPPHELYQIRQLVWAIIPDVIWRATTYASWDPSHGPSPRKLLSRDYQSHLMLPRDWNLLLSAVCLPAHLRNNILHNGQERNNRLE